MRKQLLLVQLADGTEFAVSKPAPKTTGCGGMRVKAIWFEGRRVETGEYHVDDDDDVDIVTRLAEDDEYKTDLARAALRCEMKLPDLVRAVLASRANARPLIGTVVREFPAILCVGLVDVDELGNEKTDSAPEVPSTQRNYAAVLEYPAERVVMPMFITEPSALDRHIKQLLAEEAEDDDGEKEASNEPPGDQPGEVVGSET